MGTKKILSSTVFSRMVMDFNSFRNMVKRLAMEEVECKGLVELVAGRYWYCRWDGHCDTLLAQWKQENDACSEQVIRAKAIDISRSVFATNNVTDSTDR